MKKLLVFVLILGQLGYAYGQNDNDDSNLVIIPPIYDNITNYAGALVVEKNHKKRIMNQSGKIILPVEYTNDDYIGGQRFPNGTYLIFRKENVKRTVFEDGELKNLSSYYSVGLISNDGKIIIPFGKCYTIGYLEKLGLYRIDVIDRELTDVCMDLDSGKESEFFDGYDTHEEICDITGKTLFRQGVDYDDSEYLVDGLLRSPVLLFRNGDEWIYELKEKKIVPWAKLKRKWDIDHYSPGNFCNNNVIKFSMNYRSVCYALNGKEIDAEKFDSYVSDFPYFCVSGNQYSTGKFSIYNYDLEKTIVPLGKYDRTSLINVYGNVVLCVEKNGKEGVINRYGKEIIPLGKYDDVYSPRAPRGLVIVKKDKKKGVVNENGDEIVTLGTYDNIDTHHYNANFLIVVKGNKSGLINNSGQVVLPLEYDKIGNAYPRFIEYGGITIIRKNDKIGAVDASGKIVIPVKYDNYESYFWDYIAFKLDGKTEIYDYKGNLMLPLGKYEDYENRFGKLNYLKYSDKWDWDYYTVNEKSGLFIFYKNGKKGVVKLW